jgi:hypothetical protein
MLSRLNVSAKVRETAMSILITYFDDRHKIVKAGSMQVLADLAAAEPSLHPRVTAPVEELTKTGSPAMQSRCQKLQFARCARQEKLE